MQAKVASFVKHAGAVASSLAPVLYVLEAAPGVVGKAAALAVTALVAVGLLRARSPKADS